MDNITDQVINIIGDGEKEFEGDDNYKELKEASEKYNEMVRLGIIKKKGYNLLTIDQANIKQQTFNLK